MERFLQIATLDEEQVQRIRELEQQSGLQIMAFKSGRQLASLDEEQLQQLRQLEADLDVVLLAFSA